MVLALVYSPLERGDGTPWDPVLQMYVLDMSAGALHPSALLPTPPPGSVAVTVSVTHHHLKPMACLGYRTQTQSE